MDIVVEEEGQQTGFLAETVEEYAAAIYEVFTLPQEKRLQMAKAARKRALRFSAANFDERFKETMKLLL